MIKSKKDYLEYLQADRIALARQKTLRSLLLDDVWKFQRCLRRLEYLRNCRKNRLLYQIVAVQYRRLRHNLGFQIPPNVFGRGLCIAHPGTIIVNEGAIIGANCRLHVCVVIGAQPGRPEACPRIGNNCYIGSGVKIFGDIVLGDNMMIGANAVVNKSFPEGNMTIAGVPAKQISEKTYNDAYLQVSPS